MNTRGTTRYTASPTGLGTGPTTVPFTGPAGVPGPFIRGRLLRVQMTKDAGPGTTVTFRFREGVGGDIRLEFTTEPLPIDKQPLEVTYEVSTPANLVLEVETDDGTNSTDLTIEVDIEGPY
jgi:hypothetical protein